MTFFDSTDAAGTTVEVTFGENKEPKYGLGYWSIRGLGAPLTMMLCAAKVSFSLFLYDIVEKEGDGVGWHSDYFSAKGKYIEEFDTPLWNLPFLVNREEKRVICQTNAVFAHLGRECKMLGNDEVTTSQCEELLCEVYDLRNVMTGFAYGPSDDAAAVVQAAKKHFQKFEAVLEREAKKGDEKVVHLVNGKFSAPDFHLFEMLDQFEAFVSFYKEEHNLEDLFSDFKRLRDFKEGFAALEENQFYLNSWLHQELPFNNCMAKFGSLPGPKTYAFGASSKLATWRGKGVVRMESP